MCFSNDIKGHLLILYMGLIKFLTNWFVKNLYLFFFYASPKLKEKACMEEKRKGERIRGA
jgi:hypothetical protein